MRATPQPLLALTAGDLMTREAVRLTEEMPLRDAAHLLLHNQIAGEVCEDFVIEDLTTVGRASSNVLRAAVSEANAPRNCRLTGQVR